MEYLEKEIDEDLLISVKQVEEAIVNFFLYKRRLAKTPSILFAKFSSSTVKQMCRVKNIILEEIAAGPEINFIYIYKKKSI
jgi:hypothetical protein